MRIPSSFKRYLLPGFVLPILTLGVYEVWLVGSSCPPGKSARESEAAP
jgi:hypothetical protein